MKHRNNRTDTGRSDRRTPALRLRRRGLATLLAAVTAVCVSNFSAAVVRSAAAANPPAENAAVGTASAEASESDASASEAPSADAAPPAVSPSEQAGAAAPAPSALPVEPARDRRVSEPSRPAAKELVATTNILRIMRDGGILMYPIAFCSLVTVAVLFERLIGLRRSRIIPKPFVSRFVQQVRDGELDRAQALQLCEENGSPVARIFAGAVRKWGRPAVEVEQAILDAGERVTNDLRRYLRVFSAVSTISPLFGLLGTVFGMIQAFNAVAASDALGRPELLANGVGNALLTTAAGLVVAIPALSLYYLFVGRVDRLVMDLDALGEEVVHAISAEDLQCRVEEAKTLRPKRPSRKEAA